MFSKLFSLLFTILLLYKFHFIYLINVRESNYLFFIYQEGKIKKNKFL